MPGKVALAVVTLSLVACSSPLTVGAEGGAGAAGAPSASPGALPCEVLAKAGQPCVAAHSTVRALVGGYAGNLYQVQRLDGQTADIGVVGGYADAASQDTFCADSVCTIAVIYDQSGQGNDLTPAPPGGAKSTPDDPALADDDPVLIHGHSAYAVHIALGMGYRKLVGAGTAVDDEPQTLYLVTSQRNPAVGCCFDYGSAETDANDDGNGAMEAISFGRVGIWGTGVGGGPWVTGDFGNGLFAGWENHQDRNISSNTPLPYDFVTALLVGDTADKNEGKGRFALYGGDASAGMLKVMYDGIRPETPGYVPMRKQRSVVLGISGDNSAQGEGHFYEGVMASGAATKSTVDALQAGVVAAGYGQ